MGLLIMGVNQCSQDANMNMTYASNFIAAPINYLSDVFSGDTSSAIHKSYENNKQMPQKMNDGIIDVAPICQKYKDWKDEDWAGVGSNLIDSFCSCSPWEDAIECKPNPKCCNSACPEERRCQLQCPNGTKILARNKSKCAPSNIDHNAFGFLNSAFDTFPNPVRQASKAQLENEIPSSAYGLGMVAARRKFNELAFFIKGSRPKFNDKTAEKNYYLKKIDEIFEGRPAKIEGYENLEDFSNDPLVQKYLKQKVTDEWLNRSIGRGLSEKKADPEKNSNKEEMKALIKNIKEHVDDLGSITLTFGYRGPNKSKQPAHALEVYKIIENEKSKILCAHDPNLPLLSPAQTPFDPATKSCSPSIEISSEGTPVYKKIKQRKILSPPVVEVIDGIKRLKKYQTITEDRELFDIDFDQAGDQKDAVHAIANLYPFCLQDKKCPKK